MKRLLAPLILLLMIAGCVTPPWVPVETAYKASPLGFSVDLPAGWMRLNKEDSLFVTRDGAILQHITVYRVNINEPLKFTKKKMQKDMLPQEVAEVALDDISSNSNLAGVTIEEKGPATISGVQGFRAVYSYKTRDGLRMKSMSYGFLKDEWFYTIRYTATQRHYFEKDLSTFQKVFESFKLQ